ncbi:MAG: class I SAM-dependent methyltransferase [Candidatus Thermoplasmatota archaeon]|nr:class I SAM-dependent methyltransferase [Candidatus Thermoplasmatota archaeon]
MNETDSTPMSVSEIRPETLMEEQAKAYVEDILNLLKHKEKFVKVLCPACGSMNNHEVFEKFHLSYTECNFCETLFINPRPTPEILDEYYKKSKNYWYWNKYIFPITENNRRTKIFQPRAQKIAKICEKYHAKQNTLLEVGAGFGTFCEEIKKLELFSNVIAVEPTPELAETCRTKGLTVIEKPIEQVHLKQESVDVVVSFEVIEHLFDPKEFLKRCASVLSPEGLLILSCPNNKGFDIVVLQEISDSIDGEHLNYFNTTSLSYLVKTLGFEILEVTTPGKLDAELVRKKILNHEFDVNDNPFLKYILLDRWDDVGLSFQQFLADNQLSSHLWLVARKREV